MRIIPQKKYRLNCPLGFEPVSSNCGMLKISESDALGLIKSGAPFSIQFITADANRKDGGKRINLENARIRNSNHSESEHGTFTIEHKDYDRPITVHIKLTEFINGKEVIK